MSQIAYASIVSIITEISNSNLKLKRASTNIVYDTLNTTICLSLQRECYVYAKDISITPLTSMKTKSFGARGTQITLQKRPTSGPAPAVAATRGAAGSGQAAKVQTGYAAGRLRLSRHCRRRASSGPAEGRRRRRILPARAVLQPACARLTYHPL